MYSHSGRLLGRIVEGCGLFMQGELELTGMQCLVNSVFDVIEEPIDPELMDYLEDFDAKVEEIRFMNPEYRQPKLAKEAVEELLAMIVRYRCGADGG